MSFLKATVVSLFLHVCLAAQGTNVIRGEVLSSKPFLGTNYVAEIFDQASHRVIQRTPVSPSGQFEFRDVGRGAFTVQIATDTGDPIVSVPLDSFGPLQIRLPDTADQRPISGVVSMARLQHRPTRKAFDEMVKAGKIGRADPPQAIEHLLKAIRMSPDFIDAHTNLGAIYMRSARYEEALVEYRTVVDLGAVGPAELCNLSVAQFATRHMAEAEQSARQALTLDSRNPNAHYVLARALLVDPARRAEARQHLLIAAPSMPQAATFLSMF